MRTANAGILLILAALTGCERAAAPPSPSTAAAPFHNVTDMKQVMNWVLEPNADVVWMSAGSIITEEGEEDLSPETDEQWQAVLNAAVLLPAALLVPYAALERLVLIGSVVLVLIVLLFNSSIEAAVDRISFEHHGLSKRAKDYGSAAVMLALLTCALVWITLTARLLARD